MFQSLIGILRTSLSMPSCPGRQAVSIPHRYPTNQEQAKAMMDVVEVSIPHRYPTNDGVWGYEARCEIVSIPHRYPTNLEFVTAAVKIYGGFNPS